MKNISFANPYLLLIAIPLIACIVIPFAIAIRKDNKSKSVMASLVMHIVIALLVTLGIAGTVITTVMTETQVIVVADMSYSATSNHETVDKYIENVKAALPQKSQLGVVCFGKDYTLHTAFGEEIKSVEGANIDHSATNISEAIDYASTLFDENAIKKVVIITDGKQTDRGATSKLINSIESLYAKGIYIDAMYVDNNISEDTHEVQINGVDFTPSTYINHEAFADVLIQSNRDELATLRIYGKSGDGEYKLISERSLELDRGFNIENISLPTSVAGVFDYKVSFEPAKSAGGEGYDNDTSVYNNDYYFTQTISEELNVLLVASSKDEVEAAKTLYGTKAVIDAHVINDKTTDRNKNIPYLLEDLCKYDEIMLANVDVRQFNNFSSFVTNIEKAVSVFGKSLVTIGDTKIQNKTDDTLKALEDMLPVKFGNDDQDKKFVGIVIDASRSMDTLDHFKMAKEAALQILNLLNEGDYITVVSFSGEVFVPQHPVELKNKGEIAQVIAEIQTRQGTFIGSGLLKASEQMDSFTSIQNKQIFLISDGMSYTGEPDNPATAAREMYAKGITVSTIHTAKSDTSTDGVATMKGIASAGGGKYFMADTLDEIGDKILSEVADQVTESVIEKPTLVEIKRKNDDVLENITSLPTIGGYVYSKAKASATEVLVAKYQKGADTTVDVPLYTYWDYGSGQVSSFTSSLISDWVKDWNGPEGRSFFGNILKTNTPEEKIDYPFTMNVEYDGTYSTVEITPAIIDMMANVTVSVTLPDGEVLSETLTFDSEKYFYSFETPELGKHVIDVNYTSSNGEFGTSSYVNLSYSPEYDSFAVCDVSSLYEVIRNRGNVNLDGNINLDNDETEVSTYTVDFTVPFLVVAIVLYIIDIIVRKIKWSDIKSLFKRSSVEGGTNA